MAKIIVDGVEVDVPPEFTLAAGGRGRGRGDPALLLPRAAVDRRQLPHVPRRGEGRAQARGVLRLGRARLPPGSEWRTAGNSHQVQDGEEGARRGDGVSPHQPSARLPDLRPGRPVRPAGPGDGLRRRYQPLRREQARGSGQVSRPVDQDLHEPVHSLHPLRALRRRKWRASRISARSGAARTWRSRAISRRRSAPNCSRTPPISARWAR